jgi:hypothetical protein
MTLSNTKKTVAVDPAHQCEHCNRVFHRDTTLLRHMCEQKRRWLDRDRTGNRIAHAAWQQYYRTCHPNKRTLEYADFQRNAYYLAFVKFGNYCVDIRAINASAYVSWLIRNRVPIDDWPSDRTYTQYITEYLRLEDSMEAVHRTMDTLLTLAHEQNIELRDVFRYANANRLCRMITTGEISPWVLYNSQAGRDFLSGLNSEQTALVLDYIDPERWQLKLFRSSTEVTQVKQLLDEIYQ